jgi:hypothetical protein
MGDVQHTTACEHIFLAPPFFASVPCISAFHVNWCICIFTPQSGLAASLQPELFEISPSNQLACILNEDASTKVLGMKHENPNNFGIFPLASGT